MRDLGIIGKLREWLYDFLKNRIQIFVTNETTPQKIRKLSDVYRILYTGTLLIIMALSDEPPAENIPIRVSYANDTKVYQRVKKTLEMLRTCNMNWTQYTGGFGKITCSWENSKPSISTQEVNEKKIEYTDPGGNTIKISA